MVELLEDSLQPDMKYVTQRGTHFETPASTFKRYETCRDTPFNDLDAKASVRVGVYNRGKMV